MARVLSGMANLLLAQSGGLFPFVPVFLGCGICLYFALLIEPPITALILCGCIGALLLGGYAVSRSAFSPLLCACAMVFLGITLAGMRSHIVAGPVIDWRYYGPVTGRVVAMDRSASDAVRITLDHVWLRDVPLTETPRRVRLSLHAKDPGAVPEPGMIVMTTGHLGPPGGAVEPGGFDFRRHAWFLRLGAVGYSRVPLVVWDAPTGGQWVFRTRMALSARIQDTLTGASGAFAAAIVTGDRSAIPQDVLQALRDTNLAHLLAISGLHMGLVSAFVFAVLRLGLLLTPVGLRWPVKKIAALGALCIAAFYLALSGANVATERAFVMVSVMLVAVMCNRRAISLRAVALAAIIILAMHPEAVLGPGFQMSFAATTALVAVFGALRDSATRLPRHRVLRGIASVALSSAIAGAATAPFAMAHFNQVAQYGLLANLATVPLMGLLVIPSAVTAICLMPVGLEVIGLVPMGWGVDWILYVAQSVADWDGAVRPVVTPQPSVLPLIALGALGVVIWRGRASWLGFAPILCAFWLWSQADRPQILVAEGGTLVGVMTPEGRALSRPKGTGFVAGVWLENDGQGADQETAAALWPGRASVNIHHLHGKRAAAGFDGCDTGDVIIASADLPTVANANCLILQRKDFKSTGSLAISIDASGAYRIEKARDRAGARLWNDKTVRQGQ
ncbi:ComEC family competence protein [Marivita sp. S6314]|uniref:ComEC/Rec2 family competence protein n=1 Tax=Marivita sp. S6314 TaxID=2926406 RepID=UPI001FF40737|nr:ComEC/Rec2 family competence protein [Marivita sp. S6314]MCK0150975.1 ComEC family competence protein [Marivita sp. S6314]